MKKEDIIYLQHILEAAHTIQSYLQNKSKEEFLDDRLIQVGVIRQFEIIGEATKRLSKIFRDAYPEISWTDMAGMRDILIHDYIDVDIWAVWNTASHDLAPLIEFLKKQIEENPFKDVT
ncbi:MAG TPA: DUF86 domain-containing protein [Cyclobacteriaceae bacterium]|nr:DUF86 domain-containing protein [Cyclobacteriaceae bacterium]